MAGKRRRCAHCGEFNPRPAHAMFCPERAKRRNSAGRQSSRSIAADLPVVRTRGGAPAQAAVGVDQAAAAFEALGVTERPAAARAEAQPAPARPRRDPQRARIDRCRLALQRSVEAGELDRASVAQAVRSVAAGIQRSRAGYSRRTRGFADRVIAAHASAGGVSVFFVGEPGRWYLNADVRGLLLSADRDLRAASAR